MTGARPGGQRTPTSLVALLPPVPVLSPTRQPFGTPARSRLSPVLLATSHAVSCSREEAESASPRTVRRSNSTIAAGVVVSRGSPGRASFNSVSRRSSRVTAVAERPEVRGQPRRPAKAVEQQVPGRVVAQGDGGVAELADGHPRADVLFGRRRVGHEVVLSYRRRGEPNSPARDRPAPERKRRPEP